MYSEFTLHPGECYYVQISLSSVSLTSLSWLIMFLVQRTPLFIYDLLLFGPSLWLKQYDLLWTLFFNSAISVEGLSIDFHASFTNTLVYGKSNSTTPLCTFCANNFPKHFKSYYSMTWHLCAVLLISYTGNLECLQFRVW